MSAPHKPTRRQSMRGNSIVEMALVITPLIFMLLSSFELARALWMYHSLTTAIKSGARFAMVHGAGCIQASATCETTVADVAGIIRNSGIGLDSGKLQVSLTDGAGTYQCGRLSQCLNDQTQWPSASGNTVGTAISVQGQYTFQSVLSSFWPGQSSASVNYVAASNEVIEF